MSSIPWTARAVESEAARLRIFGLAVTTRRDRRAATATADARQHREHDQAGARGAHDQRRPVVHGDDAEDVVAVGERDQRAHDERDADDERHRLRPPVDRGPEQQYDKSQNQPYAHHK